MDRIEASLHPCQTCGACCAYFRVSFFWREAVPGDHEFTVPDQLTVDATPFLKTMRGTEGRNPSCVALAGRIGKKASCTIYESRPTPCRDFEASYESGQRNPRCDQARAAHGLSPLTPQDWKEREICQSER